MTTLANSSQAPSKLARPQAVALLEEQVDVLQTAVQTTLRQNLFDNYGRLMTPRLIPAASQNLVHAYLQNVRTADPAPIAEQMEYLVGNGLGKNSVLSVTDTLYETSLSLLPAPLPADIVQALKEARQHVLHQYMLIRERLTVTARETLYQNVEAALEKQVAQERAVRQELQENSAQLARDRGLLTRLLDSIPDLIFYKDVHGVYLGCNDAFAEFVGRTQAELVGKTDFDLFDPEVAAFFQAQDQKMMAQQQPQRNEEWVNYPDGRRVLLDTLKTPFYDADKNLLGLIGLSQDITSRKLAEEELRRSEAELSEALKIAKLGYWEYDVTQDVFTFNDQFYTLFHTTAEQHGGYQVPSTYYAQTFVHPDDMAMVGGEIGKALTSTERHYRRLLEHRILYADGGVGYMSVNVNVERDENGTIVRFYGANQDITDRKLAEEELRRSEAELSEALKIAKLGYWEYDVTQDVFTFNDQFYSLFHTTAEQHGGYQVPSAYYAQTFVHPDDMAMVGGEIGQALTSTERHYRRLLEHRILYADGGVGYMSVNVNVERDENGTIVRFYGANQDITTIHESQAEVLRLSYVVQQSLDGTAVADMNGIVQFVNPAWAAMHGYTPEELIGEHLSIFHNEEQLAQEVEPANRQAMTTGQPQRAEIGHVRKDGSVFPTLMTIGLLKDSQENTIGLVASAQDITEQKAAQVTLDRRVRELQAVAEVGTTTATILVPDQLVQKVVDLAKDRFHLYHAHIYLLDEEGRNLDLVAGAGEVGRQMTAEGWQIPLNREQSLVARVARSRQAAIVNDVYSDPNFLPNPLLPHTRAELVVPIVVGDTMLGVLDVQADTPYYFSEDDVVVQSTLASQIGVALQNARSFTESEVARQQLSQLTRRLTREGWEEYLTQHEMAEVSVAVGELPAADDEALDAVKQPLVVQGEPIGQLVLARPQAYSEETAEIITAVTESLSAHLENLRLTQSSEIARANAERRGEELGLINRMMSSVTASLDLMGNMQIIAKELAQALDVSHVGIALITKDQKSLEVVSEFPEPMDDVIGTLIPIAGNPLTEQAVHTGKFAIAYDAQNNPLTAPIHELLRHRGVHMLAVVPMIVGNEFFGTVGFDQTDPNRVMTEQQLRLAETIVYQAATVVQNARLFNQTQEALAETNEQARRLALLNDMSEAISRQTSLAGIVDTIMAQVPAILDVARMSLHLIDNADKTMLRIVGTSGPDTAAPGNEKLSLADTPMAQALATRQLVTGYFDADDERLDAYFAPLFAGERPIGTFNVAVRPDAPLTANDRHILAQIASILGTVLVNRQLFDQAQARVERERLLNKIVTQVAASLDLQHSLQIIVDEMATALNVDQVRVALIQPESSELLVIAEHYDPKSPSAIGLRIPVVGNALTQEVIATRKMIVVEDAQNSPRTAPVHGMFREQGIQTVVILPLIVNDEVIGTIGLDILDERSFDADTLQLAETIVYQAAVAIQNARLFEQSQAALAETETLYAYTSQLNAATNLDAVLDSAAAPGFQVGATDALLFVYDQDSSGQAQFGQFLASSPRNVVPLGQKFLLNEQPFARFWPSDGKNVLLVGDVSEDRRLTPQEKQMFAELNIQAVAVMFLSVVNRRLGQIVIRWHHRQTFTSVDERLYGAIAQQTSSVVYNRLLFNQTEEALSETAALYQASADLNTAQTYEDVLTALRQHTVLGQGSHSVTINFFDHPWEKGQLPEEVYLLAAWGGSESNQQPARFRIDSVPGFLDLVSSEEMVIHADIATDERISEEFRAILINAMNVRGAIYAPLVIGSRRVGYINGYYPRSITVSEDQLRRLNVLVSQAAVSVQSIHLYEQTQKALAETEALYVGSESIVLSNSEQDVLHGLIQSTMLQSLDRANVFMFDQPAEDGTPTDVTIVAQWENEGVQNTIPLGTRFMVEEVPFLSMLKPDEAMIVQDIHLDPRVDPQTREILEGFGMRSFVLYPLVAGNQWLGLVAGQSAHPIFTEDVQVRRASSLVGQAAVVIQTTRLFRQEQARARREQLLREIAAKVRSSTDVDSIMRTAVTEIGRTLGRRAFIKLSNGQLTTVLEENGVAL